ncbi:MAG TPA: hypothetical protein VFQ61_26770 [Polyangiaceae bacterium]|nr:hypothetical protein [Polyangiaceae bacterium]
MTRSPDDASREPLDFEERRFMRLLLAAAREEEPDPELREDVLRSLSLRPKVPIQNELGRSGLTHIWLQSWALRLGVGAAALGAAAAWLFYMRANRAEPASVQAELPGAVRSAREERASAASRLGQVQLNPSAPCSERRVAQGERGLIDDFEDGNADVLPYEGRRGFWSWVQDSDFPRRSPELVPVLRPDPSQGNRFALHVQGKRLLDWGASIEFTFTPSCYDARVYRGLSFQARGPGRIYVALREVSVIPPSGGGTCKDDCHNPHVHKVDLDGTWKRYTVSFSELTQRGYGHRGLDPSQLNSVAFFVRSEDTPYDVWIDDVTFEREP